jgi:hypothetical protein
VNLDCCTKYLLREFFMPQFRCRTSRLRHDSLPCTSFYFAFLRASVSPW